MKCEGKNPSCLWIDDFQFPISKELKYNIDWDKVFSMITSYKTEYNERMMRFVKSELISLGLERWSNNYLTYVDEIGYDFVNPKGIKIEMKSGLKLFQFRAGTTVDIKISNTNGQSSHDKEIEKTFDYLLLIDEQQCTLTSWEKARPYMTSVGDGVKAKIPLEYFDVIKINGIVKDVDINLADRIQEAMNTALDDLERALENVGAPGKNFSSVESGPRK